jgi:GNAT superfamily N-acetyltransferase
VNTIDHHKVTFENLWQKDLGELKREIITIWKQYHPEMEAQHADERARQIVFVIKNEFDQVVGISTAFKAYIKQLRNYLYAFRILILPEYRRPGLAARLIVETRDFLESIHQQDETNRAIGVITLVENEGLKKVKREAIFSASKLVYIGNSSKGHHIRVYYFTGATI